MVRRAALGVVATIGMIALSGADASAAVTKTFQGPSGASWFAPASWNPMGAPATDDTVIVQTGIVDLQGGDATVAALTVSGGTIAGVGGNLTVNGPITWTAGGFSGSGSIFAKNGVDITGSASLDQRTFQLDGGTATLSGATTKVNMASNAVFDNRSTFAITGDGGAMNGAQGFGGSGVFINRGTLQKTAAANSGQTQFFNVGFNNAGGTVQVAHGTLQLSGGGTSTGGTFTISAPGGIDFDNGSFSFDTGSSIGGSGAVELSANATVACPFNVTGATTIAGGLVQLTGAIASVGALAVSFGTAAFNSSTPTITPTSLNLSSTGVLTGGNAFVLNSLFVWSGGTIAGTGGFTANAGIDMDGSTKNLDLRTVTVTAGPISFAGGTNTLQMSNNAVLDLGASVTLDIDTDGGFDAQGFYGSGTIRNAGLLRKVGDTGTTNIEVRVENSGTVENDASGSTLRLAGGSNSTGSYIVAAGAVFELDGGDHEIKSSATLSGTGTTRFHSGTTTIAGAYNISGTTQVEGGLVNFEGTVNNVGALTISNGSADFSSTSGPIAVSSATLSGGLLTGADTINVGGAFAWTGGRIEGTTDPSAIVNAGAGLTLGGGTKRLDNRSLRLTGGTANMSGAFNVIELRDNAIFINQGTLLLQNDGGDDEQGFTGTGTVNNQGVVRKTVTGNTGASRFDGVAFNNSGTVEVLAGNLRFTAGYKQTAGLTRLDGGTITAMPQLEIQGGALEGTATISADVLNGGEIRPGASAGLPGLLTIAGSFTQTPSGKLVIEIGGANPPQFDRLAVVDAAELGGTLDVRLINQFVPLLGNIFPVVTYNGRSGDFSHIDVPAIGAGLTLAVVAGNDEVTVEVVQGQPTPNATATITATAPPTSTPSAPATASRTATAALAPSNTSSPTPSRTPTNSPPPSATPSATASPSASPSRSPTAPSSSSPSASPTSSPTGATTNTPTASPSRTPTQTPSAPPSGTPALTPTAIATSSASPTTSSGPSVTPSATPSSTPSVPPSQTPTGPTRTPSPSSTPTTAAPPTNSPTTTPTAAPSQTPSATPSPTPSHTATAVASATATASASATPPATATGSPPATGTATAPPTSTPTPENSATPTHTPVPPTATLTATPTHDDSMATILVGSASGLPGGEVSIQVVLQTNTLIRETVNDIEFRPEAAVAANSMARPLCAINPDINKSGSFAFRPPDCVVGVDCNSIRALLIGISPANPIPSGSVLYACTVAIAASAAPGDYPLTCTNAQASNPDGASVRTSCIDGVVSVVGFVSPTPTSTPPPPTGTASPPNTPTRTQATPRSSPNDDGCQVAAQATSGSAWLLTLPLLWLARRRRGGYGSPSAPPKNETGFTG
jgi:hypothetical protein